jgi:cation:H+ antiporter
MINAVIFFLLGFGLLYVGGESTLRGTLALAHKLKLSKLLVSALVIGFGTSLPELTVSLEAVLTGYPDIALGNIIGSNTANILLVIAIAAILSPIFTSEKSATKDVMVMLLCTLALIVVKTLDLLNGMVGIAFLIALSLYVFFSYRSDVADKNQQHEQAKKEKSGIKIACYCLVGIALLIAGGHLLINSAVTIARSFNISEAVIGLTVVAIGTSLPELTTAILASIKKQNDIIIGNILGSNIFNILGILGITILVQPIPITEAMANKGIIEMTVASILFAGLVFFRVPIGRVMGTLMLSGYFAYLFFILM